MEDAMMHIETRSDFHHIAMSGRWIAASEKGLLQKTIEDKLNDQKLDFIVDMSQMQALNSTGIKDLVDCLALTKQHGKMMIFTRVPHKIVKLLEIVQINSMLTVCDTLESAQALLNNR